MAIRTQSLRNHSFSTKMSIIVISIQLFMIGIFELSTLGYNFPILRAIIGFIFVTFIPGILLIKILKIDNLSITKFILFSVGLSISFVMFFGFSINELFPHVGIQRPLSNLPVMVTLILITIIMSTLAYFRDINLQYPEMGFLFQTPKSAYIALFCFLFPIFAIIGSYMVSNYHDNTIILILLFVFGFMPFIVLYNKSISYKVYPLIIYFIALTLLFHYTSISSHIVGFDIHTAYYVQDQVINNSIWTYSAFSNVNSMLSIVILCPLYSIILDLDSVWVFKVIYPLIFAFVPLGLFEIYREQFNPQKAFLATFFVMSIFTFFSELAALPRQQIAELFYVLVIMLLLDDDIPSLKKSVLSIIFILSISVSHYGLAYIVIFNLTLSWLFLIFMNKTNFMQKVELIFVRFTKIPLNLNLVRYIKQSKFSISGTLIILFITFTLSWYLYITPGPFYSIIYVGQSVIDSFSEFFKSTETQNLTASSIGLDFFTVSFLGKVYRVVHITTEFLIVLGFFQLIMKPHTLNLKIEYISLSLTNYLLLFMCIILPSFSAYLNVTRFYHIILIFLAPFFIVGYESLYLFFTKYICNSKQFMWVKRIKKVWTISPYLFITVLLTVYFLFNTGFILEVSSNEYVRGDTPGSIVLNYNEVDAEYFNLQEVISSNWLCCVTKNKSEFTIFADLYSSLLVKDKFFRQVRTLSVNSNNISRDSYLYLRSWNIDRNVLLVINRIGVKSIFEYADLDNNTDLNNLIITNNKIYNNGGSHIYYKV